MSKHINGLLASALWGVLPAAALLLAGCYNDEGNYTYDDSIHDISVGLNSMYGVRLADSAYNYTIHPNITTADGDRSYLSYTWVMNTSDANSLANDTIGHDSTVTLRIDPDQSPMVYNYYLRLYVNNSKTNTVTMVPTQLEVAKPYTKCWLVLHNVGGHAEMGSVEYAGSDVIVTPNAYSNDSHRSFTGKPLNIATVLHSTDEYTVGYNSEAYLYVNTTNQDESGIYNQTHKFDLVSAWSGVNYIPYIDPGSKVDLANAQFASSGNGGLVICSNGQVARNWASDGPYIMSMTPDQTVTGNYYISKIAAGPHTAIGYDSIGHRFVHLALQTGSMWSYVGGSISRIPYKNGTDAIDPNRIDPNETVINIVNGYHYDISSRANWQRYSCYAYALGAGSMSHVYVFRYYPLTSGTDAVVPADYEFVTPDGVTQNTPMASGPTFNNIIFYAAGNKIYRLDISTGNATVIWQSDDPRATISCLKMAVDSYAWGNTSNSDQTGADSYGVPFVRVLGAGVNLSNGTGEMVVLQLNTAGRVDDDNKYPSIQINSGFGPIKDIAFI